MADEDAIDRVMNPAKNPYRVDMLDVSYHSPMMRALNHASYVFEKRLSHTADSQDQRHRMVPASRPMMTLADTIAPDYVTPRLIRQNPAALAVYEQAMIDAWTAKNKLLALGVPLEYALYILPNAKALRLVESGSFIALQHKWTLRTCFNAQEEIYLASMDEIGQVKAIHPQLGRYLGPPCVLRNKIVSPRCTEGTHFCGVPVWNTFPNAVRRLINVSRPSTINGLHAPPEAGQTILSISEAKLCFRGGGASLILPWIAHLYTATGAVIALLATGMAFAHNFRAVFIYFVVATFIDATDGVLARALRVKERLPNFDGAQARRHRRLLDVRLHPCAGRLAGRHGAGAVSDLRRDAAVERLWLRAG